MRFGKYLLIFLILGFLITPILSFAEDKLPQVILFHSLDCPHCKDEIAFLEDLKQEVPELEVVEYEVKYNEENAELFIEKAKELGLKTLGVPLTIIGDEYFVGFDKPENSGEEIKRLLGIENNSSEGLFSHPIFGSINIKELSLPILTVALGTLDGFNPCSMWALVMLITLLIASGSKKKVWIVGGVFILTSAISYFLFMTAWFNAFLLIGYVDIVRVIIGLVAIVAGTISIREFYKSKPGVCEISDPEKQKKISQRIKDVLSSSSLPVMIAGVIGIAFSVNLVEMLCSLGIPVVYTETLALHNLATWKYYAYIGLYDFFYMLDDIVVLVIAGFSMKFLYFSTKYTHYSRIVVGILMVLLGVIFIFNPELLSFS